VRGSTYDGTGRERPRSAGPSNRHPGPRLSEGFGGGYSPAHASSSSFARRHRGSGNGDEDGDGDWNGDGHGDGGRNGNGDVVRRLAAESSQSRSRLSSGSSAISDRLARLSTPKVRPDPEFASPSYYNVAEAYDACYKKHKPKLTFSRARLGEGGELLTLHWVALLPWAASAEMWHLPKCGICQNAEICSCVICIIILFVLDLVTCAFCYQQFQALLAPALSYSHQR
jgi:hypothetical protein